MVKKIFDPNNLPEGVIAAEISPGLYSVRKLGSDIVEYHMVPTAIDEDKDEE